MNLKTWLDAGRGRVTWLAAELKVSQPTVSDWSAGKKRIPLDHCPFIQRLTGGACTCEELRPDRVEYFAEMRAIATTPTETVEEATQHVA